MIHQPHNKRVHPAELACQEYGIDIPLLPHDFTQEWIADFIWSHNGDGIRERYPDANVAEIIVEADAYLIRDYATRIRRQQQGDAPS